MQTGKHGARVAKDPVLQIEHQGVAVFRWENLKTARRALYRGIPLCGFQWGLYGFPVTSLILSVFSFAQIPRLDTNIFLATCF